MTGEGPSFDPQRCALSIPNELAYLEMVQGFVHDYVRQVGFDRSDQARFDLLVEEAVTNVIQGAYAEGERADFSVACERVPAGVQITVHDDGLPYDPSLTPEYRPDADLDSQTAAGLGSFLMRQMADVVEFHNLGSLGKDTVFVKYLESPSVTDAGPPAEAAPLEAPEPVREPQRIELWIADMRPEQAIDVCRCIYDAYRYTYVNEHMYFPDRVVALNRSGDMLSAVATTVQGEVAGHAALVFPEDTREIADMAIVAVKAKFRGQSIARRLGEYLETAAHDRGMHGLYIEEVTVHTYTQKFCHRLGFADCGFLLAYVPAITSYKGINEKLDGRGADIMGYRYLQPPQDVPLYVPERHRDMVAALFANLGAPFTAAPSSPAWGTGNGGAGLDPDGSPADSDSPPADPDGPPTELHTSVNVRRAVATIRIPVYGADLVDRLRQELYRLKREDVKVIDAFLNMRLPHSDAVAVLLEKQMGFLFTGILPGGPDSDWLVLQHFNGVVVDYDAIQVEDQITRDLLEYIRGNDPQAV